MISCDFLNNLWRLSYVVYAPALTTCGSFLADVGHKLQDLPTLLCSNNIYKRFYIAGYLRFQNDGTGQWCSYLHCFAWRYCMLRITLHGWALVVGFRITHTGNLRTDSSKCALLLGSCTANRNRPNTKRRNLK